MKISIDEITEERTDNYGPYEYHNWGETRRVWVVSEIRSERGHLAIEVRCDPDKISRDGGDAILSAIYDQLS